MYEFVTQGGVLSTVTFFFGFRGIGLFRERFAEGRGRIELEPDVSY